MRWEDNIMESTGMYFSSSIRAAGTRFKWNGVVVKSSVVSHRLCRVTGKTRLDQTVSQYLGPTKEYKCTRLDKCSKQHRAVSETKI